MDERTYEAYLFIAENHRAPDWLKGNEHKKERDNLMRQRHKYHVKDGKLYYRKAKMKEIYQPIENAPILLIDETPKEGVHFKKVMQEIAEWKEVPRRVSK